MHESRKSDAKKVSAPFEEADQELVTPAAASIDGATNSSTNGWIINEGDFFVLTLLYLFLHLVKAS